MKQLPLDTKFIIAEYLADSSFSLLQYSHVNRELYYAICCGGCHHGDKTSENSVYESSRPTTRFHQILWRQVFLKDFGFDYWNLSTGRLAHKLAASFFDIQTSDDEDEGEGEDGMEDYFQGYYSTPLKKKGSFEIEHVEEVINNEKVPFIQSILLRDLELDVSDSSSVPSDIKQQLYENIEELKAALSSSRFWDDWNSDYLKPFLRSGESKLEHIVLNYNSLDWMNTCCSFLKNNYIWRRRHSMLLDQTQEQQEQQDTTSVNKSVRYLLCGTASERTRLKLISHLLAKYSPCGPNKNYQIQEEDEVEGAKVYRFLYPSEDAQSETSTTIMNELIICCTPCPLSWPNHFRGCVVDGIIFLYDAPEVFGAEWHRTDTYFYGKVVEDTLDTKEKLLFHSIVGQAIRSSPVVLFVCNSNNGPLSREQEKMVIEYFGLEVLGLCDWYNQVSCKFSTLYDNDFNDLYDGLEWLYSLATSEEQRELFQLVLRYRPKPDSERFYLMSKTHMKQFAAVFL